MNPEHDLGIVDGEVRAAARSDRCGRTQAVSFHHAFAGYGDISMRQWPRTMSSEGVSDLRPGPTGWRYIGVSR